MHLDLRTRPRRGVLAAATLAISLVLSACAAAGTPDDTTDDPVDVDVAEEADGTTTADADDAEVDEPRFPDVVAAELEATDGTWRLNATLSSPYDTPERYADAFRALSEDGTELGVRELAHDHANEQPFTRALTGLEIPAGVERITVQGRDQRYGWGGATVELAVPSGPDGDG